MYIICQKLKRIKGALKELNKEGFSDVQAADVKAHKEMIEAHTQMHNNPGDVRLVDAEIEVVHQYHVKHGIYVDYLRQKAKADWIRAGDENTALFHQSIKARRSQNQVYNIFNAQGTWIDNPEEVPDAYLSFYKKLLGSIFPHRTQAIKHIVQEGPVINDHHREVLNAPYTRDEIMKVLFSIPGTKAPGPDGFGSSFYKDSCDVVGNDVLDAVMDVLQNGRLLKELNQTIVTLIPKTKCPKNVSEFRPISCCNTLYKCIAKVIGNRIGQILPDLILENQGGFMHGRLIVHNVMVVKDLVRHYGRKSIQPSCMKKLDLQKAYDTVDWSLLREMLEFLNCPRGVVELIM